VHGTRTPFESQTAVMPILVMSVPLRLLMGFHFGRSSRLKSRTSFAGL